MRQRAWDGEGAGEDFGFSGSGRDLWVWDSGATGSDLGSETALAAGCGRDQAARAEAERPEGRLGRRRRCHTVDFQSGGGHRDQPRDDGASDRGRQWRRREVVGFGIDPEGRADRMHDGCHPDPDLAFHHLLQQPPPSPTTAKTAVKTSFVQRMKKKKKSQQSINSSIQNPANLSITRAPVDNFISRLTRQKRRAENEIFIIS